MMRAKRALDVAVSAAGLLLLAPLLVVLAVAIRLDSPGPAIFRQERVGMRGRRFVLRKFRTMTEVRAPGGFDLTVDGDARITTLGAWLRSRRLDELPQLINVLFGDMSLVGPRPELPQYVDRYSDEQRRVLDWAPGITDPASIAFRNEGAALAAADDPESVYLNQILPEKLRMSLEYAERASLRSDLGVILQTLRLLYAPSRLPSLHLAAADARRPRT